MLILAEDYITLPGNKTGRNYIIIIRPQTCGLGVPEKIVGLVQALYTDKAKFHYAS